MRNPERLHRAAESKPVPGTRIAAKALFEQLGDGMAVSFAASYASYARWAVSASLSIESEHRWKVELQKAGLEIYTPERKKMVRKL